MRRVHRRTFKFLALLIAAYLLLLAPGLIWPAWLETPVRYLLLAPYLSVFLFHRLGVPGLLENNGLCGWGWCSPTPFGIFFSVVAWLAAAWLVAWGLAWASARFRGQ